LFLPGLQKMGAPVPLSGHSMHFRTSALQKIGAWDLYNVTEDCDIAIRLHRIGFQTGVIDSVSKEEATDSFESWIKQRSRWMKGFMQTSIVNIRNPIELYQDIGGFKNFIVFGFIVPGMIVVNLLNMFYWLLLIAWYLTLSPIIKTFFPTPILYMSVFSFVAGNFIFIYLNIIGAYRRGRYGLVKYTVLSPLYWLMLSAATVRAAVQIVTSPHNWEKTEHGNHLQTVPAPQTIKVVSGDFSPNIKVTPAKERQF
jgi:cellulose synthase/poly-beta-1,6-N-acetylglucosamine synthase-like glycosyltransferase